jgi:hypothetical protein
VTAKLINKGSLNKINFFCPIHFHPFHNADFECMNKYYSAYMGYYLSCFDLEDYMNYKDCNHIEEVDNYYRIDIEEDIEETVDKDYTVRMDYAELRNKDYIVEVVDYKFVVCSSLF